MVNSIHDYIERNDESAVKHWLNNCIDTDELDWKKRTPIYVAAELNYLSIGKLILKKGCNINLPNEHGHTPLHIACFKMHYKFITLLISNKADLNILLPTGDSVLNILASQVPSDPSLHIKACKNIIKNGCKITFCNKDGETALHTACKYGRHDLVQLLIDNKASVDQTTINGENALHFAVIGGNSNVTSLILKLIDKINAKTKDNETALDIAKKKQPSLVKLIEDAKFQQIPWRNIHPEGKWPIPRCNHSASQYNNRWYIFGGENDIINPTTLFDDIHFFHGESKEWRLIAPLGEKPPPLTRHTSLIFGTNLYIFGGTNLEKTYNDIWILDLEKMKWKREIPSGPYVIRPRCCHTMTKISDSKFVIIGGSSGNDYFNDIHQYDILTKTWERINIPSDNTIPTKRHLHSATICDNCIYIFGGCNQDKVFNDILMLEIDTWKWFELDIRGIMPLPRSAHSAILINNSVILIYGGLDSDNEVLADIKSFDLETYTWIKYESSSSDYKQPLHRAGHIIDIIDSSIYTFGGNSIYCLHELLPYVLDNQALAVSEELEEEKKVEIKPPIPDKPSLDLFKSIDNEKLYSNIHDLLKLIKEQKPSLSENHPILQKCKQIETIMNIKSDEKPPLPSKPIIPAKVIPSAEFSNRTRRRPPSMQVALPSLVHELSISQKTNTPKKTKPVMPITNRATKTNKTGLPTRGRSISTSAPNSNRSPIIPTPNRSPVIPNKPQLPKTQRGGISKRGRATSSNSPSTNRSPKMVNKKNLPNMRSLQNKTSPVLVNRTGRSKTSPINIPEKKLPDLPQKPLKKAPISQTSMLPSVIIKPESEFDSENSYSENNKDELVKLAHTQPTQYKLPPSPDNPILHYEKLHKRIPKREKVILHDFKDKKEKQLYEITNELVTTEESYLHDLSCLIGLYKKPLEHEYEGCIPAHYLEIIFGNTENLFDLHVTLFSELLLCEQQKQSVGIAFMKVINLLPQYNSYCTNQINATETVQKLLKTNQPFIEFTTLMKSMSECKQQDIHNFLIKPFQRVTRYPLLLKELLKQTQKGTKDYQYLQDSITRIDAIVVQANEEKRQNDSLVKLIEIQKSFAWQGEEGQLKFSPNCKFILESKFKELDSKTQKATKRHFFLFNEMVVIAKEMGKKYKKIAVIPLDSCIIWDIPTGSPELPKNKKYAFSIVATEKSVGVGKLVMCAKTQSDKDNWINSINSAIAQYMKIEKKQ